MQPRCSSSLNGWDREPSFRRVQTQIPSPIHQRKARKRIGSGFTVFPSSCSGQKYNRSEPEIYEWRGWHSRAGRKAVGYKIHTRFQAHGHAHMDLFLLHIFHIRHHRLNRLSNGKTSTAHKIHPGKKRERPADILSRMGTNNFDVLSILHHSWAALILNGNLITSFKKPHTLILAQWAWLAAGFSSSLELWHSRGIQLKSPLHSISLH